MKRPPRYTIMSLAEALAHGYRYLVVEVTPGGEVLNSGFFYYSHNAEAWTQLTRVKPYGTADDIDPDDPPY